MLRLAEWAIARPLKTIAVLFLLSVAVAPGLLRLELRTDGQALVPADDPVVRRDAEVRQHFGLRDPVVVLLAASHPQGIYNPNTLRRVREISEALGRLPCIGPQHVVSLASERRDRFFPDVLEFRPFLEPLPTTSEELQELRSDIDANELLNGTLIAADRKSIAILVGMPPFSGARSHADSCGPRVTLYRQMQAILEPFEGADDQILIVGAPVAESLLGLHILEDLVKLLPLALTLVAGILWLGCRRFWGVVLGLAEVGAALVWTFGLMGWLGFPVYLTTAVLPVILTAIGLADEIHIFWHHQRLLADGRASEAHGPVVLETMRDMVRPVTFTSLTTTIGFLSFLASPIVPVRSFGLFAAIGILFCMLWSLTVVPAVLSLLPAEALRRARSTGGTDVGGERGARLQRIAAALFGRRRLTLVVLLLITAGLGAGVGKVHVQDSWIGGFAPKSSFRQATDRVNEALYGTHILALHLTFDPPEDAAIPAFGPHSGPLLDPAALAAIGRFEAFLRTQPQVGGVLGAYSHVAHSAYLRSGRLESSRAIPKRPGEVLQTILHLERVRSRQRRGELIDDAYRRTIVTVFLKDANYRQTVALMEAIRVYERQHLWPQDTRLDFTGDVAVSQVMIPAIVESQVASLVLALAGAFLVMCLLYRSPRRALLGVLPASVASLWIFGIIGWLGIPLGVATSMFCAITLGIGIDHSIHFLERSERARAAGRQQPELVAVVEAGPAILADTLAVALGFGLLAASQVPANGQLGLLVALALIASCLLTLVGLGAWLASRPLPQAEHQPQYLLTSQGSCATPDNAPLKPM